MKLKPLSGCCLYQQSISHHFNVQHAGMDDTETDFIVICSYPHSEGLSRWETMQERAFQPPQPGLCFVGIFLQHQVVKLPPGEHGFQSWALIPVGIILRLLCKIQISLMLFLNEGGCRCYVYC